MNEVEATEQGGLHYHFRPKMVGAEAICRLGDHSVEFMTGSRTQRWAYPMIARVRLSYRPSNLSMRRYIMEIWPRGGLRIEISSVSFLPSLQVKDHAPEYRKFVQELHRKIAESRGECVFEAGFPVWRWWPLAGVGVAAAGAAAFGVGFALFNAQFMSALVLAAVGGLFLWQIVLMVSRNRPQRYRPDAIPEYVLPNP